MLKIKEEYLDVVMSSPFDKRVITLRFLDKGEYKYWYNIIPQIFEDKKVKNKYIKLDDREN